MNKRGFTLVELAVVLVIIGILIGGLLAALTMISTAKSHSFVRQISQFDAAVESFYNTYNQMPGDNNVMGQVRGNNDGIIATDDEFRGEVGKFWGDLSQAGLVGAEGNSYVSDSAGTNSGMSKDVYTPRAVAGNDAHFVAFGSGTPRHNFYYVGTRSSGLLMEPLDTAFTPEEVITLDSKIDDANPNDGNVMATNQATFTGMTAVSGSIVSGTSCVSGGRYNLGNDTEECSIRIRIGATTGKLR